MHVLFYVLNVLIDTLHNHVILPVDVYNALLWLEDAAEVIVQDLNGERVAVGGRRVDRMIWATNNNSSDLHVSVWSESNHHRTISDIQ